MAVIIQPAARRTARTMALLAAALGLSRIRAGLHYPSDVAAGALLGYVVGRALRSG
jgi:membrane-associated phospholipid phosphatase